MTSASPILATVMPLAPAFTCMAAIAGVLWVFVWGLRATAALSAKSCIPVMLRSRMVLSTRREGVSRLLYRSFIAVVPPFFRHQSVPEFVAATASISTRKP